MKIEDTKPYIKVMEQIKRRVDTINACADGHVHLSGPPRVESAALQLRMVLELVALGSLAANKELFKKHSLRFEKRWRVSEIMKDLEKLNPNFYPVPFREGEPDTDGIRRNLPPSAKYLTKSNLVEVHGRCGNVLHARNPFRQPIDYDTFLADVIVWTNKVVTLLNAHEIWLLGNDHFHIVHMSEKDNDAVRMYTFKRIEA